MLKRAVPVYMFICVFLFKQAGAQVSENFSDGNFSSNPVWAGNTADWLVNNLSQLQSNNTIANSTFYLSTPNTLAVQTQWEFLVNLAFNTSSANYVDVFITASQSDVSNTAVTGYFVRIGNTEDEISLYRKDAGTAAVKIIDGINGITNTSNLKVKIKVLRTADNQFTLLRDVSGTGLNYVAEGAVTDGNYTSSTYFGIMVKQSTASFFQKHFFDDIEIKTYEPDVTPPSILLVTAVNANTLHLLFDKPVDERSAQNILNYSVNNNIGAPILATINPLTPALVELTFAGSFVNRITNTITITSVQDVAGNTLVNATATFSYFVPQRFDVLITEIMADPAPVVALPNAKYVELKNTSGQAINLQGWRLSSATSTSGGLPAYSLPADNFVVLTTTASAPLFSSYGRVLGMPSFPSLNNAGAVVSLLSKENTTIHVVDYSDEWYQNAVKKEGGWSLEMIDTRNPCSGNSNWKASTDLRGGTPGATNSVAANNPDQTPPALLRAFAIDNATIQLIFDEPLDSTKAAIAANYTVSDGIQQPVSAVVLGPLFTQVQIKLGSNIVAGKVYTVTVNSVSDCSGNVVQALRTAKVGLAEAIDTMDIVINEVLFNPAPSSVDYVEIYNRSNKTVDLKDVYLTNRSSITNTLGTLKQLSTVNLLMFPGDYYVISDNAELVKQAYVAQNPGNFINVNPMPSLPDAAGVVVLLNAQGTIVDELRYDEKWHFKLLDNKEGISLERIDYNKPTQRIDNWHSAASTAGFGTPSYQNSQFRADVQLQGEVTIAPKTFSPDNDGTDDFTFINYKLATTGFVANITIFDAGGRPVKSLAKNATLALQGSIRWDGLDDKLQKLPIGTYIIYTDIFDLNGKRKTFKNTVVLARRF